MKKSLIALLFIINPLIISYSQETDYRELFLAAESYFLFEEFSEALPLYLRIHRNNPDNDNVNFKIGVCFLNDPYQKNKSISYLEKAVENINPKYKENNFKEKAAPLEALFYLGDAYRVNNQLEEAKDSYKKFLARMDPGVYDEKLVNDQIEACDAAQKMMQKPIDFDTENLGDKINTRFADINPAVSGDETKMAFISELQFYDAVFFTEKVDGKWTAPRNIIPELGVDGDVYPTSLSYDGTEMFIYRNDDFIGNLYSSRLINGKWTALKKLNENINTRFWESHASLSKDGKTLYFSSNRRGGYGGLDIYKSEKQQNGTWGPAINLGPLVNSEYNDDTPFITEEENKLFFSSYGHYNMGGYDIFMSKKDNEGNWSRPVNLGYPINTTDDNQFFIPLNNGQTAYYSRYDSKGGYGRHDIFRYEIYTQDYPRMYTIEGVIDLRGFDTEPGIIDISVVDQVSEDTISFSYPDDNFRFRFEAPEGKYDVIFDSEKFKEKILKLEITPETPRTGLVLETPVTLDLLPAELPVEKADALLEIREDSIIYVEEGEKARIRYNAEKGSKVVIDVYNDSELILSDTFEIDRKRQRFVFDPSPGENDVHISLTNEEGDKVTKTLKVIDLEPRKEAESGYPEEKTGADEEEYKEEVEEEMPASPVSKESSFSDILEALKNNAEGNLKTYLDNFDPDLHGISDLDDLIRHLYDAAEKEDFSSDDVSELLKDTGLISDLDVFIRELAAVASPELNEYLLSLDPENMNIETADQLIRHLFEASEKENFTRQDVIDALAKYYGWKDIDKIIEELLYYSDDALREYLSGLDPRKENVKTINELLKHLINNAEDNDFSEKQVIDMFESYFTRDANPLSILERLKNRTEGDIRKFLDNLDQQEISGMNRGEFYDYLVKEAVNEDIDLIELLRKALDAEGVKPENLTLYLNDYGSAGISEALTGIPPGITRSGDLFKNLADLSIDNDSIDTDELIDLVIDYLNNKDFYELYYDLIRNSEGKLKDNLKDINIRKTGIKNGEKLIGHLKQQAEEKGYTTEDIYNALSLSYADAYILNLIDNLINIAEGTLKNALQELDPRKENIKALNDIIVYLLDNSSEYGYTEQDVYNLIEKYLSLGFEPEKISETLSDEHTGLKGKFSRGAMWTAGILILEGLLILILILLARRKKKKKEERISSDMR